MSGGLQGIKLSTTFNQDVQSLDTKNGIGKKKNRPTLWQLWTPQNWWNYLDIYRLLFDWTKIQALYIQTVSLTGIKVSQHGEYAYNARETVSVLLYKYTKHLNFPFLNVCAQLLKYHICTKQFTSPGPSCSSGCAAAAAPGARRASGPPAWGSSPPPCRRTWGTPCRTPPCPGSGYSPPESGKTRWI